MTHQDADVLVTGATGLIGRWLLAALTARGRRVAAVVRGAAAREAELRGFVDRIGGDGARVAVLDGDVEAPGLGLPAGAGAAVRDVYHAAARFEFGLSLDEARRVNLDGTRHTVAWARARPALRRIVLVGGYRLTRPVPAHAGAYEATKHEAWRWFRDEAADLPWTAVHPSTVIGDSRTGETTQQRGLGEMIERLWQGTLPALVGTRATLVPVVPVDHLAAILATVPERDETRGQELVALDPATPPLPELVAEIAAHLGVPAPRRVVPIGVARALPRALTKLEPETLAFLTEDRYDTAATEAHARAVGLAAPARAPSVARWCDHLVATRFGHAAEAIGAPGEAGLRDGVFVAGDPATAEAVYLHGMPWNGDAWAPVARRAGVRGARIDLPGFGRSGLPRGDGATGDGAGEEDGGGTAWLARLLAGRGGGRGVVLVGHSLGAVAAVHHAHAHPEQVRAVVLVSPAFLQRRLPLRVRLVRPLVARALRRATPAALAARLLPQLDGVAPDVAAEALAAVASAAIDLRRRGTGARVARALAHHGRAAVRAERARQLGALRCPVVLVRGADDPLVVPPPPGAEEIAIAGAGHDPQLTHPAEVAAVVRRIVRG